MEIGSTSLLGSGSRCCSWVLILPCVLVCLPLICCCGLVLGAAGLFSGPRWGNVPPLPGLDGIPPVQTVPVIPAIPTGTPSTGALPLLDLEATPLFGFASLESGFSPDPYTVEVVAGGNADTTDFSPACGYTSYHPAFVLDWQGGDVPETFLRIFFTPDDRTDATLLVHTPEGEWLCEQDTDPVLDLPLAPPGEYAIWVGTRADEIPVDGSLSITGSMDVTP